MKRKLVIVTGGSSGIGAAILEKFSQENYQVINLSRKNCRQKSVINLNVDLSDPELSSVKNELVKYARKCNEIILIHNAFSYFKDSALNPSLKKIDKAVNVAIKSPMTLNKLIIPYMKNGSCIIYIGSTLSTKAVKNNFSYVTLKHAVIGMMKATVQDLFGKKISCFCICPGFTDTPMLNRHLPANLLKIIKSKNSFNRLVTPEEIAKTLFQLTISPAVNGAVIDLNLGQYDE
jgi:3-oxoacyl-[acyl-carrier protein] reductase